MEREENTGRGARQAQFVREFTFGLILLATLFLLATPWAPLSAQPSALAPAIDDAKRLPLLLRKLDRTARLLYVTAHPDDEDAALISRLVHGEGVEVALLTLTRGNGGQNEIGGELFDALAVLRSAELDAAHRFDGARQLFGSADDFGYSFSVEETFEKWGRDKAIDSIVAVIRSYQPDVILTLPPSGPGGGQHHQASAQAAIVAFDRAADGQYRPDLGAPHQTQRLFQVLWQRARGKNVCSVPVDDVDPVLGCSYAELGARSRAQHKCQGMARVHPPFPPRMAKLDWLRSYEEELRPLDHPFEDLVDQGLGDRGLGANDDAAMNRMELTRLATSARNEYRSLDPSSVMKKLIAVRAFVQTLPAGVHRETLFRRATDALIAAMGFSATARGANDFVAAGETFDVTVAARNGWQHPVSLRWTLSGAALNQEITGEWVLDPFARHAESFDVTVASGAPTTIPFAPFTATPFTLTPRPTHACQLRVVIRSGSLHLELPPTALESHRVDANFPSVRATDVNVVPDPSVRPARSVVATPHAESLPSAEVEFLISTLQPGAVDVVFRSSDASWTAEPARLTVECPGQGREVTIRTRITGAKRGSTPIELRAEARRRDSTGTTSTSGYRVIDYPHIRRTALLQQSTVRVVPFECARTKDRQLGYVAGTGDAIPVAIAALGYPLHRLSSDDLLNGDLDRFETIVLGVRAYKVRDDLIAAQPRLNEWMKRGGHLVVQYNKFEFNTQSEPPTSRYVPYPGAVVSSKRVTVEESPLSVDVPDHGLITTPNKLTAADWQGWVQERGLYFLEARGEQYQNLITVEDPWPFNPGPKTGALVTAEVGEGRWTYVGLGLFRQLPAGVPGAYRLLANLLADQAR